MSRWRRSVARCLTAPFKHEKHRRFRPRRRSAVHRERPGAPLLSCWRPA